MYKFEVSAESIDGLERKIMEAAEKIEIRNTVQTVAEEDDEYENEPAPESNIVAQFITTGPIVEVKYNDETDITGVIWDAELHDASKAKKVDGSWKKRTTRKPAKQAEVKAVPAFGSMTPDQYQEALQPVQTPPPPAPTIAVDIPFMPFTSVVTTPVAPVEPVVVPIPTVPQPGVTPAHSYATFKNNITLIFAHLINEKKIDQAYIEKLKEYFQIKEIWNITASEKQTIELYELFGKLGFITMVD